MSKELRVNWKASLTSAFGFKRPTDATQFDGIPCPAVWKQQFGFPCFLSPSLRETMSFCLSETVFPPLREAVLSRLCDRHCCFPVSCFQCACASSPFLSVPWLVDAGIPHVVISHLLKALDLCFCYVILRIKTSCLIVIDISDIQRASRVSSSGSIHSHNAQRTTHNVQRTTRNSQIQTPNSQLTTRAS